MSRPKRAQPTPPRCLAAEIRHFAVFAGIEDPHRVFGLDRTTLEDPEAMVPITVYYEAIERAAERSGSPHFGLGFARYWTKVASGGLGAMQFLVRSSPCWRIACERIIQYQRYWNQAEWYDLVQGEGTYRIRYRCWGPPREAHVHQAEKMVMLTARVPRAVDPSFRPLAVAFPHSSRGDQEELTRVLGVTPTYGAPWVEVTLPAAIMEKALPDADPRLFEFFDRYMRRKVAAIPREEQTLSSQVQAAVERLLYEPGFGQDLVARTLGRGARTLARRLADEGTALREIVDTVRQARAEGLLQGGMSIAEVAFLLGYSEPAAFHRAFRRWKGMSPGQWLEDQGSAPDRDVPLRTAG